MAAAGVATAQLLRGGRTCAGSLPATPLTSARRPASPGPRGRGGRGWRRGRPAHPSTPTRPKTLELDVASTIPADKRRGLSHNGFLRRRLAWEMPHALVSEVRAILQVEQPDLLLEQLRRHRCRRAVLRETATRRQRMTAHESAGQFDKTVPPWRRRLVGDEHDVAHHPLPSAFVVLEGVLLLAAPLRQHAG